MRYALLLLVMLSASAAPATTDDERIRQLTDEVAGLKSLVYELQTQVAKLTAAGASTSVPVAAAASAAPVAVAEPGAANSTHGVTMSGTLDGYYAYNGNSPAGRVNSLRAYDVSSNSFSLNQADLVVESAVDKAAGKRFGVRMDLQWGQATQTLQGNPANELRPEIYRNVFQAYGTYVFPVGNGITVDFGKWASSLGVENNYTKDQLNYSRAFWFNFLPYYHTGVRASYAVSDALTINYWLVNGVGQAEDFNAHKDQLAGFVLIPAESLTWTFNYYVGQEHADVAYVTNPPAGQQILPNQQGASIVPIANAPDGSLRITDTYLAWQATKALTLAAEADYVEQRLYSYSTAAHVTGGAVYAGYKLSTQWAVAARAEYLADRGGLFSGTSQYLKEGTLTLDYRPVDGFLMRTEYRRDQSNQPYFLGHSLATLEHAQPTFTLGLVWWFGPKQGSW